MSDDKRVIDITMLAGDEMRGMAFSRRVSVSIAASIANALAPPDARLTFFHEEDKVELGYVPEAEVTITSWRARWANRFAGYAGRLTGCERVYGDMYLPPRYFEEPLDVDGADEDGGEDA